MYNIKSAELNEQVIKKDANTVIFRSTIPEKIVDEEFSIANAEYDVQKLNADIESLNQRRDELQAKIDLAKVAIKA